MNTNAVANPSALTLHGSSVPPFVVSLIEPDFDAWDRVGVVVGTTVEADVEALELVQPGLGARAARYWQRCREFWDAYAAGATAGPAVVIERRLVTARQSDTRQGRVDLVAPLAALEAAPAIGALVTELTGAAPDLTGLDQRYAPLVVSHIATGDETVVTVEFPARQDFDPVLGGPHARGELRRRFRLTVNHAKWRDRRVRRLVAVDIDAVELWPDPTSF